jgi:gamma-glutamyltranspeptidase/glutathione hydrolase
MLIQLDLSATLGRLRGDGVGALYAGPMARDFVEAASRAGFKIDPARLRDALPEWSTVQGLEHDNHLWAVAGQDPGDSALAEVTLALVFEAADWTDGDATERRHLLAEAMARANGVVASGARTVSDDAAQDAMAGYDPNRRGLLASRARLADALGEQGRQSSGATGFYMVDRAGLAVGCAIGLGAPFGTGRTAPGFGFLLGRSEVAGGDGPGASALVVGNTRTGQLHLAMASSGGRPALSALLGSALDHWELREHMDVVVAAPRTHYAGGGDVMAAEPTLPADQRRGLESVGYRLAEQPELGRVSGFRCVEGIPRRELRCEAAVDPRSRGLGFFERGK